MSTTYSNLTLEALSRLARANRENRSVLDKIHDELSGRYSFDARELRQKVQQWLEALEGSAAAAGDDRNAEEHPVRDSAVPPPVERNEFGIADAGDVRLIQVLERMRERLLDLTNRNALLSYRHPRTRSVRVVDEVPAQVFGRILAQGAMSFVPLNVPDQPDLPPLIPTSSDTTTRDKRARQEAERIAHARRLGIDPSFDLPAAAALGGAEHSDSKLQTLLKPHELEKLLRGLHRDSINAVQESGANMLHLMFGFVEWRDIGVGDTEPQARLAPLVLVPVRLSRGDLDPQTRTYRYTVEATGEDWSTNVTLQVKCRREFGFELPAVGDEDENLEAYFLRVEQALAEIEGWRLRRFLTLGLVSFGKILMWRDMDATTWPRDRPLLGNGIFREILGGHDEMEPPTPGDPIVSEYPVDSLPPEEGVHLPLVTDADSSQHSVLVDVRRGKNLVVQGPPGTGKSQTITNLIGEALARGKKVLFVAEKKAALDVVAKRLTEAGLGPFCLALHSHTSQKREFLDDMVSRLNLRGATHPSGTLQTAEIVADEMRTELNGYVERLHEPFAAIRMSPFAIFWRARRLTEALGAAVTGALKDVRLDGVVDASAADVARARAAMERYAAAFRRVAGDSPSLDTHPWVGVANDAMTFQDVEELVDAAAAWKRSLEHLDRERLECSAAVGGEVPESPARLRDFAERVDSLAELRPGVPPGVPLAIVSSSDVALVQRAIDAVEAARAAWARVPGAWGVRGAVTPEQERKLNAVLSRGCERFGAAMTSVAAAAFARRVEDAADHTRRISTLVQRIYDAAGLQLPRTARIASRLVQAVGSLESVDDAALQLRSVALAAPDARERVEVLAERARVLRAEGERLERRFDPALTPEIPALKEHVTALSTAPRFLPWVLSGPYRRAVAAFRAMTGRERTTRDLMTIGVRELLSHRIAVEAFNGDAELAELFGPSGKGISSPFERALQLLDWRRAVLGFCSGIGEAGHTLEAALWNGSTRPWRDAQTTLDGDRDVGQQALALTDELDAIGVRVHGWTSGAPDRSLDDILDLLSEVAACLHDLVEAGASAGDSSAELGMLLDRLTDLRRAWDADRNLEGFHELFAVLGVPFAGPATDIRAIVDALEFLGRLRAAKLPAGVERWLIENDPSSRVRQLKAHAGRLTHSLDEAASRRHAFEVRAKLDAGGWLRATGARNSELESTSIGTLVGRLTHALGSPESLHPWASFRRERAQVATLGLGALPTG